MFFFYTKITNFDGGSKNIKYVFNANLIIDEFIVYPKSYICNDIYPINSFFFQKLGWICAIRRKSWRIIIIIGSNNYSSRRATISFWKKSSMSLACKAYI